MQATFFLFRLFQNGFGNIVLQWAQFCKNCTFCGLCNIFISYFCSNKKHTQKRFVNTAHTCKSTILTAGKFTKLPFCVQFYSQIRLPQRIQRAAHVRAVFCELSQLTNLDRLNLAHVHVKIIWILKPVNIDFFLISAYSSKFRIWTCPFLGEDVFSVPLRLCFSDGWTGLLFEQLFHKGRR